MGMAKMKESQVFGWQGHRVSKNMFCFKHTSNMERDAYFNDPVFPSCYVEDVCAERDTKGDVRFTVGHNESNTTITKVRSMTFYGRTSGLPTGHSYLNSSMSIIQTVFERQNLYHNAWDNKAHIFSVMYDTGLFNLQTLELDTNVDIFTSDIVLSGDVIPKPGDFLYQYLTNRDVNYNVNLPGPGKCMRRAFFHVPHYIEPDLRNGMQFPVKNAIPTESAMLFSRYIMSRLVQDTFPSLQYIEKLKENPNHRNTIHTARWMAKMERKHVWPAITNRTGAAPMGTHIIFLRRVSSRGREISNWDQRQARMSRDLSARGYTYTFIEPSSLHLSDQILLFTRGTILVSSHGAGLTHAMWMQPKSIILEARRKNTVYDQFFKSLAVDFDLTLFSYENRVDEVDLPNGSMQLDIDLFAESVKSALWRSDQIFGSPPGCKSPITIQEATLAHFKVYVDPKDTSVVV